MSDPKGEIENISKRLKTFIENGIGNIGTVTLEWDETNLTDITDRDPLVSVRVTNVVDEDVAFGRYMTTTNLGSMATYYFTAHIVASACAESGESTYRYVNQHADDIKKYLKGRKHHATEIGTYGIWDFIDLNVRQSPLGAYKIRRNILEGAIEVEVLDNP
jgi:hypothetical protein